MNATRLTDETIDSFLREQPAGTLSLTNGQETYAVPESFGYDGTAICETRLGSKPWTSVTCGIQWLVV